MFIYQFYISGIEVNPMGSKFDDWYELNEQRLISEFCEERPEDAPLDDDMADLPNRADFQAFALDKWSDLIARFDNAKDMSNLTSGNRKEYDVPDEIVFEFFSGGIAPAGMWVGARHCLAKDLISGFRLQRKNESGQMVILPCKLIPCNWDDLKQGDYLFSGDAHKEECRKDVSNYGLKITDWDWVSAPKLDNDSLVPHLTEMNSGEWTPLKIWKVVPGRVEEMKTISFSEYNDLRDKADHYERIAQKYADIWMKMKKGEIHEEAFTKWKLVEVEDEN